MKILLNVLGLIVALVVFTGIGFFVYGRENTWAAISGPADQGTMDLLNVQRTEKPHDALLCSPSLCDSVVADETLPTYDMSPAELIAALDSAARVVSPRLMRVDNGGDPATARYVTTSNLMRFPDTNWVQAIALDDGRTGLIAYARAQIGHSDMGANKARLVAWTNQLSAD